VINPLTYIEFRTSEPVSSLKMKLISPKHIAPIIIRVIIIKEISKAVEESANIQFLDIAPIKMPTVIKGITIKKILYGSLE